MLSNAYFLAKIGADTAENEQHFAEILPTVAFPEGRGFGGSKAGFGLDSGDSVLYHVPCEGSGQCHRDT